LPLGHCNALQVVVRGDKAVAVIDFHAIAAAPGVPTHGPDHAGVGCVDQRAASRGEILAPVELARQSGERIDPQPEGRARKQHFERRVEFPGRRPVEGTRRDIESANAVLIEGLDRGAFKRHRGFVTCLDRGRRRAWGHGLLGARGGTIGGQHSGFDLASGKGSIACRSAQTRALETESEDYHDSEEARREDPAEFSCEHQVDDLARLMMLSHSGS
jgi:hypothetical protein